MGSAIYLIVLIGFALIVMGLTQIHEHQLEEKDVELQELQNRTIEVAEFGFEQGEISGINQGMIQAITTMCENNKTAIIGDKQYQCVEVENLE